MTRQATDGALRRQTGCISGIRLLMTGAASSRYLLRIYNSSSLPTIKSNHSI